MISILYSNIVGLAHTYRLSHYTCIKASFRPAKILNVILPKQKDLHHKEEGVTLYQSSEALHPHLQTSSLSKITLVTFPSQQDGKQNK